MHSRIMRRTAMIPPWPVSPSMMTGKFDAVRDPARDLHALGHRRGADVREPGVGADDAARADEARLAAGLLHDARVGRRGRVQHDEHLALAVDELLQQCCFLHGQPRLSLHDFALERVTLHRALVHGDAETGPARRRDVTVLDDEIGIRHQRIGTRHAEAEDEFRRAA